MMNWRNIKHLTEDDYGKPILLMVMDKGYDEPRYISCFITVKRQIACFGMVGGQRIVCSNFETLPDNASYIRIDEIKY